MVARLETGAIVDDVVVDAGRRVSVRFARCPAGWEASFELTHDAVAELAVVHRLVAPSLREAKVAVPRAVSYLTGSPVEAPVPSL